MARTRSQKPATTEETKEEDHDAGNAHQEGDKPPSTFNGQLTKFQYAASRALSTSTSSLSSIRKSLKRVQEISDTPLRSSTTPSSPRPKKKRKPSKYADPAKYAHLAPLTDILEPNLICVFVGTNPGIQTATAGHAYAHPSNHFWKLLHSSGLTDRRLHPSEDRTLPARYCMGNTNIVERPSKDAAELSKEEMVAGAAVLEAKFAQFKPEAVCIVGKGIWEAIWRYRYGKNPKASEFKYGWQDETENMGKGKGWVGGGDWGKGEKGEVWRGSRVFVATSTSGLAASLRPAEKEAIWRPFGEWVQKRREERGFVPREVEAEVDGEGEGEGVER